MSICNAKKNGIVKRIINPYTQDIRIANPNGRRGVARTLRLTKFVIRNS